MRLTSHFCFRSTMCAAAILVSSAAMASTVVLGVGGPPNGVASLGPKGQSAAASDGAGATFQVNSALKNARFDFDLFCYTSSGCSGLAYLTNSPLGPTGSIAGLKEVLAINGGFQRTTQSAFSGLDLTVGIYSLVIEMTVGHSAWVGSQSPIFGGDGRATHLSEVLIPSREGNYFPTSKTTPLTSYTLNYNLLVDPVVPPVPLPASALLLLGAIGALGAVRNSKRA